MIKFKAEYFQGVEKLFNDQNFEDAILKIKGQANGISLKYFFMLAGDDNRIKPDRMVCRFLQQALCREVKKEECQELLSNATKELRSNGFPNLTLVLLDNRIWNYQRTQKI